MLNKIGKTIKKYIPNKIKNKIKYMLSKNNLYENMPENKRRVYIFLAADYANLGDVAITYAQNNFLNKYATDSLIIEVPISETYTRVKSIKKIIKEDDLVTVVGGGNMGNLYEDIEEQRRFIIKSFPKNKIVSFPQSIYFTDDRVGDKSKKKTIKVYNSHKNLKIFAREEKSFNNMKKTFNQKIELVPDIVLTLDKSTPKEERKNILICLRNDKEKILKDDMREMLYNELSKDSKVIYRDTHIDAVNFNCKEELDKIWNDFRKSKVVVTDRLHGMIFASITGTPCVVINNNNSKIIETYKLYLKNNKKIIFVEDPTFENIIKKIKGIEKMQYKENDFNVDLKLYNKLIREVL